VCKVVAPSRYKAFGVECLEAYDKVILFYINKNMDFFPSKKQNKGDVYEH
jgi:hypothetical protein